MWGKMTFQIKKSIHYGNDNWVAIWKIQSYTFEILRLKTEAFEYYIV
jgi:hypothetical protein